MRIYHKRNFAEGVFMLGLGVLNLTIDFVQHDFTMKSGILCAALFLLGGMLLVRSLSRSASLQDKIEALDERNRLVRLQSESKAFAITQSVSLALIVGCMLAYAATESRDFIGIIVGLGLAWGISVLADLVAFLYYESKT